MTPFRSAPLLLVAALLICLSGCRTAGVGDLTRREALPKRAELPTAAELLAEHNRNAERVQSLQAKPSINFANRRIRLVGRADGKLALERPRNFKLVMSAGLSDVADIGSNDQEFWIWVKDSPDHAVLYCNYDENGESPLPVGIRPDWIVEALGMRVISDTEAANIKVSAGPVPDTLLLTERQKTRQGDTVIKETVLWASNRRVKEHRVYAADAKKTLLTQAVISEYKDYAPQGGEDGVAEKVYLPSKFRLDWGPEKLALDVYLNDVKVNVAFSQKFREGQFVEPKIDGVARVNMAERAGVTARASDDEQPTSVRETMPAPAPKVRLSEPAPIGVEGSNRRPRDPSALAADLPPSRPRGIEKVVGPQIPTVDEPQPIAVQARSGWRNVLAPSIER